MLKPTSQKACALRDIPEHSLSTAPISQLAGTKWRRSQDSEAEAEGDEFENVRPYKLPLPREPHPLGHELSDKNLRLHNKKMDDTVNISRPGSIKWSSSQQFLSQRSNAASDGTQGTKGFSSVKQHITSSLLCVPEFPLAPSDPLSLALLPQRSRLLPPIAEDPQP